MPWYVMTVYSRAWPRGASDRSAGHSYGWRHINLAVAERRGGKPPAGPGRTHCEGDAEPCPKIVMAARRGGWGERYSDCASIQLRVDGHVLRRTAQRRGARLSLRELRHAPRPARTGADRGNGRANARSLRPPLELAIGDWQPGTVRCLIDLKNRLLLSQAQSPDPGPFRAGRALDPRLQSGYARPASQTQRPFLILIDALISPWLPRTTAALSHVRCRCRDDWTLF
jgi:hypothetical protein